MTTHAAKVVMATNGGLLTWAQARDSGLSHSQIRSLLRDGTLVALRRGVYVEGEMWRALDPYREQHRLRTRAVIAGLRRGFVVSHDSSAHELALEILLPPVPHTHVTRPGSTTAWSRYGVKHHYAAFTPDQKAVVDGLDVLDMARTAVDIAREHGEPYGEIACDSAMRHGVSRDELEAACAVMTSWPHILRTKRAVAFADPRAESLIETLGRIFVAELGIGPIDLQFPARVASGRVRWGDMRVGCHLIETDGHIKFMELKDGGLADRPPHEVAWEEKKRDRELWDEGLGASHLVYQDFWPPHRAIAKKRVLAEYENTCSRFGLVLPERLARQAREIRGERGA